MQLKSEQKLEAQAPAQELAVAREWVMGSDKADYMQLGKRLEVQADLLSPVRIYEYLAIESQISRSIMYLYTLLLVLSWYCGFLPRVSRGHTLEAMTPHYRNQDSYKECQEKLQQLRTCTFRLRRTQSPHKLLDQGPELEGKAMVLVLGQEVGLEMAKDLASEQEMGLVS